jgi:hypothetical protein
VTVIAWIGTTVAGLALGITVSTALLGAGGRPLSPVLGGLVFVALFGALIGAILGVVQLTAIRRIPWRMWIAATAFGSAAGFAGAAVVGEQVANLISPTTNIVLGGAAIQISAGAMVGLGIGSVQWLVLRRLVDVSRWWIAASAVGAGLGYASAAAVLELLEVPVLKAAFIPSFGAIVGLFTGAAQGVTLWRVRPGRYTPARR